MKKIFLFVFFAGLIHINVEAQQKDSTDAMKSTIDTTKKAADTIKTAATTTSSSGKTKKDSQRNGFGIKAGLNFANVTNVSSINGSSETGFHAGIFFGSFNKGVMGSRTELLYSRQGYGYSSDTSKGAIQLDYIQLAQFFAINASRYVQIQIGMQIGYLLHAANNPTQSTGVASVDKILDFYNRFDYALGGGVELHPFSGCLIGARYTISLTNLYKESAFTDPNNSSGVPYSSGVNFKNNVVQLFVGFRF